MHNAGRSQMAAAFFNALCPPHAGRAVSAGTSPAAHVHPEVVTVMREVGIDLHLHVPTKLTETLAASASHLVTLGCGEACPYVPGLPREDWPLPDPKGRPLPEVRLLRDALRAQVEALLQRLGIPKAGA